MRFFSSNKQRSDWGSSTYELSSFNTNNVSTEEEDEDENRDKDRKCFFWLPCCKGCIIGALVAGLVLAICIALWLTSTKTYATSSSAKSKTTTVSTSTTTTVSTITSTTSTSSSSTSTVSTSTSSISTVSTSTSSTSTASTSTSSTSTTSTSTSSISTTSTSTSSTSSASTSTTSTVSTTTTTTASTASTTTVTVCTSIKSTPPPYTSCSNLHWNKTGVVVAGTTQGSSATQFSNPTCLYIDASDILYICDNNNNRIQKWIQCQSSGITVGGSSAGASGSTSILLSSPEDVVFDKNGFMYVVDHNNHRVQRFPPNSTIGTTVAGTNTKTNALTDLEHPTAIDIDDDFNIYILDMHNNRVVRWAPNATNGTALITDNNIDDAYDLLLAPGSPNQVYISNEQNHKIYLWEFNASIPTLTLSSVTDGTINSTLNEPRGMVFDPYGNLYVADSGNDRVVMYCANSTVGIVVASGTTPLINQPMAVALDSNLNLYVLTDGGDNVIAFPRQ